MSPLTAKEAAALLRFPRVSGDEPGAGTVVEVGCKFSPRERG